MSYGIENERTWEVVDGVPELWEGDAFFSPKSLERRLRVLQVIDMPSKQRDKTTEDLKRVWAGQRIKVGATEPSVSASSAGQAVVRHYDLPGWP